MRVMAFLALFAGLALLFVLVPQIDLLVAGLFYRPEDGFFLRDWPLFRFLFHLEGPLVLGLLALVAILILLRMVPALGRWHVRRSVIAFIVLSFVLGPGLLVNEILKTHVDRSRPGQIVEFGGTAAFTPALTTGSGVCERNCAFVSGHASLAFAMIAFAFLLPPGPWRKAAMAAAVLFGSVMGLARMAQGAHFLSDIVFAGLFTIGVVWALHVWIVTCNGFAHPRLRPLMAFLERGRTLLLTALQHGQNRIYAMGLALTALAYVLIDRPMADWARGFDPALHNLIKVIARQAETGGWLIGLAAAVLVLFLAARLTPVAAWKDRLKAWAMGPLFVLAALLTTGLAVNLLKILFGRARPKLHFEDGTYGFFWFRTQADFLSFPSGHAISATAFMVALYLMLPRHLAAYVLVGGAVVLARVLETAHYLSDVMMSVMLAIVITRWTHRVFLGSGLDPAMAFEGRWRRGKSVPWPERLGLARLASRLRADRSPQKAAEQG